MNRLTNQTSCTIFKEACSRLELSNNLMGGIMTTSTFWNTVKFAVIAACILALSGVIHATVLTHSHRAVNSNKETPIPETGWWRCKVEGPISGNIWCGFEVNEGISGYRRVENGDVGCGETRWVTTDYNFRSYCNAYVGEGKATAWTNETSEPYCPEGQDD